MVVAEPASTATAQSVFWRAPAASEPLLVAAEEELVDLALALQRLALGASIAAAALYAPRGYRQIGGRRGEGEGVER